MPGWAWLLVIAFCLLIGLVLFACFLIGAAFERDIESGYRWRDDDEPNLL